MENRFLFSIINNIFHKIENNGTMIARFSFISFLLFVCLSSYSQNYNKEVINLWDNQDIPFNKENIDLNEKVDSTGRRITQISNPKLFVYRKNVSTGNGAALLFIPGGGYAVVSLKNQGESVAKHFLKMGFDLVAVLKYRLPDERIVKSKYKVPLCDAQKALSLIHKNSKNWQINRQKIAVMGSSAGGHLAASLANLSDEIIAPGVKQEELEQAVSILQYPVISFKLPCRHKGSVNYLLGEMSNDATLLNYFSMEDRITKNTPPTYLVHAKDDKSVPIQNSKLYAEQLKAHGIPCQLDQLEKGGHGFGLNFSKTGVDWTQRLEEWLRNQTDLFRNSEYKDENTTHRLKIILKLDDLSVQQGICECLPTLNLLKKKQIKAGFGIIPARCDSTILETLNPYLKSKNDRGENLFEIWHHGWDHVRPEFQGTGYEYQKSHFGRADKMVKEYLGIQMRTFGTPFNASDSITNQVISENAAYEVFMFSDVIPNQPNGISYLENRTNMENGTGNPEFNFFTENYEENKKEFRDYMILQGHPNNWTADKLYQFEKILDFLISENCEFVLPIELRGCITQKEN